MKIKNAKKYGDHHLRGQRKGQGSARLSRSYRIIYKVTKDGTIHIIKRREGDQA